jgi:hypothetical protein
MRYRSEKVCYLGGVFGVNNSSPRNDEILRSDGSPVRPLSVVPQVECIFRSGLVNTPRASHPRQNFPVGGFGCKAFVHIPDYFVRERVASYAGI